MRNISTVVFSMLIGLVIIGGDVLPLQAAESATAMAQPATAMEQKVPLATNLYQLSQQSKAQHLPIVLVYSASDCSHCERLEEDVLRPMLFSGDFEQLALVRKYMVDGYQSIVDFDGQSSSAERFSRMHDVEVTPTIQFVDENGRDIVPPIVGYQSPDMFVAYFLQALETSKQLLRQRATSKL